MFHTLLLTQVYGKLHCYLRSRLFLIRAGTPVGQQYRGQEGQQLEEHNIAHRHVGAIGGSCGYGIIVLSWRVFYRCKVVGRTRKCTHKEMCYAAACHGLNSTQRLVSRDGCRQGRSTSNVCLSRQSV